MYKRHLHAASSLCMGKEAWPAWLLSDVPRLIQTKEEQGTPPQSRPPCFKRRTCNRKPVPHLSNKFNWLHAGTMVATCICLVACSTLSGLTCTPSVARAIIEYMLQSESPHQPEAVQKAQVGREVTGEHVVLNVVLLGSQPLHFKLSTELALA